MSWRRRRRGRARDASLWMCVISNQHVIPSVWADGIGHGSSGALHGLGVETVDAVGVAALLGKLRTPPLLSCGPGGNHPPTLGTFRKAFTAHIDQPGAAEGYVDATSSLLALADEVLLPWIDLLAKGVGEPGEVNFMSVLAAYEKAFVDVAAADPELSLRRTLESWGLPGSFCPCGLLAALFLFYHATRWELALVWIPYLSGWFQGFDSLTICEWPLSFWSLVCLLDFKEGALSAVDLDGWRGNQGSFSSTRSFIARDRCRPPPDPPVHYGDYIWHQSAENGNCHATAFKQILPRRTPLVAAVVGHHAGLSKELQNSLMHAMPAIQAVRSKLYGQFYPEADCVAAEPLISGAFAKWFSAWEEGPEAFSASADSLASWIIGVFKAVAATDPGLGDADLILCHYPACLCMMLRDAFPAAPIVHLYDSQAFRTTPPHWLTSAILGRLPSLFVHSSLDVFFTTSPVVSAQIEYVAGIRILAVTPTALYFDCTHVPGLTYPALVDKRRLVLLFFRTHVYWQSSPGMKFQHAIVHFLNENRDVLPPLTLAQQPGGEYWPCDRIVAHDVAVFVPEDLVKMSFWELYRAALPMFVPSRSLVASMLPDQDGRWRSTFELFAIPSGQGMLAHFFDPQASLPRHVASSRTAGDGGLRDDCSNESCQESGAGAHMKARNPNNVDAAGAPWFSPFDARRVADGYWKVHQWTALADYWNFPAVQHFRSVPELLVALISADLATISEQMRRYHLNVIRRKSACFYVTTLRRLLEQPSSA
eukprot:TRINITY_DN50706_c0_g1_i1.p1 TRINITY_DN50706_c0_g1~~TRINITY_DN50706_c0_g1_i1.p1  ORF type:complete len:764 (-),score=89.57 TRINITY_DN50706_c0_g1_i1:50-2341(-)